MSKKSILLAVLMVIVAAFVITPHRARAATLIVNSAADHDDGACDAADCTLREAVLYAAAGDTISFDPAVASITLGSEITITRNLTISGPVTISGGGTTRIFSVSASVNVSLSGVTLTGGYGPVPGGGAVYAAEYSMLSITNSIFQGNRADGSGGAIRSSGNITVTNSTFSGNQAGGAGGAIHNMPVEIVLLMTITNSTFSGNRAGAAGGAIFRNGEMTITNSAFSGNQTDGSGGAINRTAGDALTITSSTFQGNQAGMSGGAIYVEALTSVTSTLFFNNTAVMGGDDIYLWSGTLNVGGSCIKGNAGASTDIQNRSGSGSVENNWWGTALGPNQGVGTTNIPAASWLTSAPTCGAWAVAVAPDDRINWRYGDEYVIFYPRQDDQAEPVIHAYCVSAEGQGTLELIITQNMLDQYPEYPGKPAQNRELFHSDVCRVPFFFYILTTGEYQINVGPDWEGKVAVIIFTELPPTNIYFYRYNILDPN